MLRRKGLVWEGQGLLECVTSVEKMVRYSGQCGSVRLAVMLSGIL